MENRCFVPRLAGVLIGFLSLVSTPSSAAETAAELADHLPGYSIARCLFPEGRMVLEHQGELLVLRQGDTLPGNPRVKVLRLDAEGALLAAAAAAGAGGAHPAVPDRMIKITQGPAGEIDVTLLSARLPQNEEPELLEAGRTLVLGADGEPVVGSAAGVPAAGAPAAGVPAVRPTRESTAGDPDGDP